MIVRIATAVTLLTSAASAQVVVPYQAMRYVNAATCPSHQCVVTFSKVPAGQRLIVTNVSAQVDASVDVIVLEGSAASYFVPKAFPTAGNVAQPVTFYYAPGETPTARMYFPGAGNASLIVTLVGNLVPAK